MADRFLQTTPAVKEVIPIPPGAPAGRRVRCCLPANGTNLRPASVIRLHSAKCKRTISRRSDVTPAGTPRQHTALVRIKSGARYAAAFQSGLCRLRVKLGPPRFMAERPLPPTADMA